MMGADKRILVGEFGRAQGVRGEVRIKSYTDDPMALARYAPLSDESGARAYKILSARLHQGDMIVARIEGVADRAAAEALTRQKIYAPREALDDDVGESEFLQSDLVGLAVRDADGETIGRIEGIENYGAGDLLAIALDGRKGTALLPFADAFVPTVDVGGGFIVIDPPAGWDEP